MTPALRNVRECAQGVLNPKLRDLNKNFDRRAFLQLGAYASLASLAPSVLAARARPNIVFILADDLGYADVGCFGAREHRTPHIDGLARTGLKLPQAYANSSICSPTRIALITGRYQYRLPAGLHEPLAADRSVGLPPEHPTLPSLLKRVGYRTALVGKWHMGYPPRFGPQKSGYDEFYGIYAGAADYFTRELRIEDKVRDRGLYDNGGEVCDVGYLTDLLAARAVKVIDAAVRAREPLFMSLHFTAPHWPWEGAEDEAISRTLKDSRHRDGGDLKIYRRMVERMDRAIGQVLAALETHDVASNTIVIFTSDNGGERFSDTWPFIGQKGELLEGGVRVPLVMRWPDRLRPGMQSEQVMISMDFLPTLLAAAGGEPDPAHPPDGENLLPVLVGAAPPRSRTLFWRFKAEEQAAVRDGELKYLKLGRQEGLFDVVKDPRERANLKARRPEDFARLRREFDAWNKTMLPYPSQGFSQSNKADGMMDRY